MFNKIRLYLLALLDGVDVDRYRHDMLQINDRAFKQGMGFGAAEQSRKQATTFGILPLPFTAEQLEGKDYGMYITPSTAQFRLAFGEQNIPAPGPHGYEQHARWVHKASLSPAGDLTCHIGAKFDKPWDHENLVPVIVTVLR